MLATKSEPLRGALALPYSVRLAEAGLRKARTDAVLEGSDKRS